MDHKVTTLDGKAERHRCAARRDLRAGAARRHPAAHGPLPAFQAPGRHAQDQDARRDLGDHQEDVQAEGHRSRPSRRQVGAAVPRRRQGVRSGRAQPRPRPAEEGARAGAEARAVRQGARRQADRASPDTEVKEAKTKALAGQFAKLGFANALIIDGAEVGANFALAARNIADIDVLPVQGINVYDILRRDTLVLTKAAVEALTERFK